MGRLRALASKLTRALAVAVPDPPAYVLARRVFLALLGACYASAFGSFAAQGRGLVGERGVWPFPRALAWSWENLPSPVLRVPSLLWLWRTDGALAACWVAGLACAAALVAGVLERWAAPLAYVLYLSLVAVGGPFFNYQWDALLLETGLLASALAWSARTRPPHAVTLLLARLLAFRLMFLSGVVKLTSGDPTWRALRGLQFHYWTQPLPTWSAYFVDKLPAWFDTGCEAAMFAIELGAPFLLFGPRRARHLGAGMLIALQVAIAATGNYGFFNLLTAALCALQLDDSVWRRVPRLRAAMAEARPRAWGWHVAHLAFAAPVLLLGWVELWSRVSRGAEWPDAVEELVYAAAPFRAVNGYGLFAVMTTRREEIDLAGSADGKAWRSYRFHYKPGPLDARPRFAPLHLPRLDWQLWFASLETCQENEWLLALQDGLLRGNPVVRGLLDGDAFPDAPPRYVRARIAPYRFTTFAELRATGAWWTRGQERAYCPTLTLDGDRLQVATDEAGR